MPTAHYPSPQEARETVRYSDGDLFWIQPRGRAKADKPIGTKTRNGYLIVNWPSRHGRQKLLIHRIVWLLFNEELPPLLDHINRNKLDNRIENLRPLSFSENARNCGDKHSKYDLPRGITIQREKYKAQIKVNGKTKHIGIFPTVDQADRAYQAFVAKLKIDGHIEGHPSSHE